MTEVFEQFLQNTIGVISDGINELVGFFSDKFNVFPKLIDFFKSLGKFVDYIFGFLAILETATGILSVGNIALFVLLLLLIIKGVRHCI